MKKILTLLFIVFTLTTFAQTTADAYRVQIGYWNRYKENFEWNEAIDCDLTFTLAKTYISINDRANTFLRIISCEGERKQDNYIKNSWVCYDEKNRRCIFGMTYYSDGKILYSVLYNDICYRYLITKTDNFYQ